MQHAMPKVLIISNAETGKQDSLDKSLYWHLNVLVESSSKTFIYKTIYSKKT